MGKRLVLYVREERTPGLTAWLMVVAFVVWLIILLWRWLLLGATIYVVGRYLWRRYQAGAAERARLCRDAEEQHAAVLRGDPSGIYGQYKPAVSTAMDRICSHR